MKNKKVLLTLISRITFKLYSLWSKMLNRLIIVKLQTKFKNVGCGITIDSSIETLGLKNISVGANCQFGKNFKLRAYENFNNHKYAPEIEIGNNFYAGTECCISAIGRIVIGNYVTLASRVTIIDHSHGLTDYSDIEVPVMERALSSKGMIVIEDNVWVCEGTVILANLKVGRNSIIAANAVVTKDVPPYTVVAGSPAKAIKKIPINSKNAP